MSAARDPDGLIRAFLAEGQTQLPDRTYVAVRTRIDRTRQRVVIGPWSAARLSGAGRLAVAAAAVVVATVFGTSLLRPGVVVPGGQSSATPSASRVAGSSSSSSPSPSATGPDLAPSPSPDGGPLAYSWPRVLDPGTYRTGFAWGPDLVWTFSVSEGWQSRDIGMIKGNRMAVDFYVVDNLVADTCSQRLATPPTSRSVDGISSGLAKLVKVSAGPTAITFGDRSGKYLAFSIGPAVGCAPGEFRLLKLGAEVCGAGCGGLGSPWKGFEFGGVRENHRMWILTVGRGSVVIDALWSPDATPADLAELQAVIDSIAFETPNATQPPVPASLGP